LDRKSGILMHLSSLSGPFGTGGLGSSAEIFADFLYDSGFRLWQILPVTPTEGAPFFSPYSSRSSFAGNRIFISPEKLAEEGMLDPDVLAECHFTGPEISADCGYTDSLIGKLIRMAWQRFKNDRERYSSLADDHDAFVRREYLWLTDYALFTLLKDEFGGLPWNRWPEPFALRDREAVADFIAEKRNEEEAELIFFEQFIFDRQWRKFRSYCRDRGISLMGDVPMFVAYDSADVWANRELFDLDPQGSPNKVAGVPPDYFSTSGQRWGNPLYNWETMRKDGFAWWKARIKKALKNFDLVRIDHFRGFSACWAVPADQETAENGEWRISPGRELLGAIFGMIREEGLKPSGLVAEDLGIITDDVKELMEEFSLPGMKILLFAFDGEIGRNPYAPHNHKPDSVVYTGTHDNNTVRGWWENEADVHTRSLVSEYTGLEISAHNVSEVFVNMALSSTSALAVIPVQDILSLGEEARMNVPGVAAGNWLWRMSTDQLRTLTADDSGIKARLKRSNRLYGR